MPYRFNPISQSLDYYQLATVEGPTFKEGVANAAALPSEGNSENDARIANDTHHLYVWSGIAWVDQGDILDVSWASLSNGPSSSVAEIDESVENAHNLTKITLTSSTGTVAQYDTLQEAFNAIPTPTTASGYRQTHNVYVPAGTYDEDITIDAHMKHINVICMGTVNIGLFDSDFWQPSGTARNITITTDLLGGESEGIRSTVNFISLPSNLQSWQTHTGYQSKLRISGDLLATRASGSWVNLQVYFEGEIHGDCDFTGYTEGYQLFYAYNSMFKGELKGNTNRFFLDSLVNCSCSGLVTGLGYSRIDNCLIEAGMTVATASNNFQPAGMFRTNITGTFTGPSSSLKVDSATNYWVLANNVTLAGGATKILLDRNEKHESSGIQFVIDGGGAEIATGIAGWIEMLFAGTIESVRLLADQSGSIVVDIWKDAYANYPPTDADSITASAVPTISSATKSEDTTLTGWTKTFAKGDILYFNVDSVTTIQKCLISLTVSKT